MRSIRLDVKAVDAAGDMYFETIAERVKYFKEEKRAKAEHNKAVEIAFEMISDGELLLQKIAQYSGLSIEEVKALASGKTA